MSIKRDFPATLLQHPQRRIRELCADGIRREVTFAELHDHVAQLTDKLRSANIDAGTLVGILGENSYEWMVADLALIRAGCVSVPISTPLPQELCSIAQICDHYRLAALLTINDSPEALTAGDDIAYTHYEGISIYSRTATAHSLDLGCDAFTLAFSSGSTGAPKAIAMSKRGVGHTIDISSTAWGVSPADDVLIAIPFTGFQQRFLVYLAITNGCAITITTPQLMYRALKELHPTFLLGPPSFFEIVEDRINADNARVGVRYKLISALYALPGERLTRPIRARLGRRWTQIYGPRMRILIASSAPIAAELVKEFWKLGQPLYETYGSTEIGWIALATAQSHPIGSAGPPVDGVSVVIDEDGEILARAADPMGIGYLTDGAEGITPFDTRPGGYIATGDTGIICDGVLTVTGRKKNLIVTSSGMKINAETLEKAVESHPNVVKAVVTTVPGTRVLTCLAWVRDNQTHAASVKAHVEELNARAPAPNRIETVHVRPAGELTAESGFLTHPYKKVNRPAANALIAELSQRPAPAAAEPPSSPVGQPIAELVCRTLSAVTGGAHPVSLNQRLRADLGIDSVGMMSAIMLLDEQLCLGTQRLVRDLAGVEFVSDIVAALEHASTGSDT